MEQRVTRLEETMRDNTAAIARIDVAVAEIRVILPSLATTAEIARLATKAEVADVKLEITALSARFDQWAISMDRHMATKEDIADLRGYVKGLPTTWVMVTAIVAGQVGITGVIAGALLAAARMFVHT
jgi:hypothetical protein